MICGRGVAPPPSPIPSRPRFRVTSPDRFCKGAPAGRGSNAVGLPSETVGEGNMPLLISSLDGEKFFAGRAIMPGSGLPVPSMDAGQSISPLRT